MIIHVSRIYGCSDPELESNVEVSIIPVLMIWRMMLR